jgi:hypothetical protein
MSNLYPAGTEYVKTMATIASDELTKRSSGKTPGHL